MKPWCLQCTSLWKSQICADITQAHHQTVLSMDLCHFLLLQSKCQKISDGHRVISFIINLAYAAKCTSEPSKLEGHA